MLLPPSLDKYVSTDTLTGSAQVLTRVSVAEHPFGTLKENMGWRGLLRQAQHK